MIDIDIHRHKVLISFSMFKFSAQDRCLWLQLLRSESVEEKWDILSRLVTNVVVQDDFAHKRELEFLPTDIRFPLYRAGFGTRKEVAETNDDDLHALTEGLGEKRTTILRQAIPFKGRIEESPY